MRIQQNGVLERFTQAVMAQDRRFANDNAVMVDENQDETVRKWLDDEATLPWSTDGVTPDEWFFITTLYGEMTLEGQRTHIRAFFPRWAQATQGDMRNVTAEMLQDWRLRSGWMKSRLVRMANILEERHMSMDVYTDHLRHLEHRATPHNPMPALDAIVADHRATGWKTMSVFIRDCVGGNSFPIDTRVAKELGRWGLPQDERRLVSSSLAINRNPRQIARMFFAAGGD